MYGLFNGIETALVAENFRKNPPFGFCGLFERWEDGRACPVYIGYICHCILLGI
uniref:Uncharacterized protein n=1 Tax=Arundo donax TaxID=35708 RepID=A0A0A9APK5_ARUDO